MKPARRSLAWLSWFTADFMHSTNGWSAEESFAYCSLLWAQFERGALTDDMVELARIARVTLPRFRKIWRAKVRAKFKATHAGWVNARMATIRADALHRSEAARESARKRWPDGANGARPNVDRDANA